jgi:SWI/SNF-related matrix-associated actin-dependent regulator 1 of chromatin subfamily A
MELYPYQKKGVMFLQGRQSALLFDEMGLGKTVQAIKASNWNKPVLVVCPAFLKFNWEKELKLWGYPHPVTVIKKKRDYRKPIGQEAVVVSYSMLPPYVNKMETGTTLIADEAHCVKNYKAQRTKRFRSLSSATMKAKGRVWAMTGTPLMNKPNEMWGLLKSIGLAYEAYGDWENFVRLFNGRKNRWNGWDWGTPREGAGEGLKKVGLGRRKRTVLPDLPNKTHRFLDVKVNRSVKSMCDEVLSELQSHGISLEDITASHKAAGLRIQFENIARIRKAVADAKIPKMLEYVSLFEETYTPLVVFAQHRAPIDALASREGWATITGDTPQQKRQEYVQMFQEGKLKGIAGTIGAMSTGLTLTHASNMMFVDMSWVPGDNLQAEDRICRIGQKSACQYLILTADHPMDELVNTALVRKADILANSVDKAYA